MSFSCMAIPAHLPMHELLQVHDVVVKVRRGQCRHRPLLPDPLYSLPRDPDCTSAVQENGFHSGRAHDGEVTSDREAVLTPETAAPETQPISA